MKNRSALGFIAAVLAGLAFGGVSCSAAPPDKVPARAPTTPANVVAAVPAAAPTPPPRIPLLTCTPRPIPAPAAANGPENAPANKPESAPTTANGPESAAANGPENAPTTAGAPPKNAATKPGTPPKNAATKPGTPPKPTAAETARKAAVEKGLRRVPDIQKTLAKLRGLPFKKKVPSRYQSAADFRKFVEHEASRDTTPLEQKDTGSALTHIGMFTSAVDLDELMTDTMTSQVGAYYDPHEAKFFVVVVTGDETTFDTLVAHELTHAIQDQHFGLSAYYGERKGEPTLDLSSDELNARRFVVEGEASLMMIAYSLLMSKKVNLLDPDKTDLFRGALKALAALNADKLRELTRAQLEQMDEPGDDIRAAMEAMDDIPPYILLPLLGAYLQGTVPVHEVFAARGWQGVADLYAHPPESTEQVLHPVEKLVGVRDAPVKLTLGQVASTVPGAREMMVDTLGELGFRSYFETWCTNNLDAAAAGWDGDTVAVYDTNKGKLGVLATTWDTEQDATEFLDAYAGTLAVRFPEAKVENNGEKAQVARGDGSMVIAEKRGMDVLIVDGATAPEQISLAVPTSRQ